MMDIRQSTTLMNQMMEDAETSSPEISPVRNDNELTRQLSRQNMRPPEYDQDNSFPTLINRKYST